MSIFDAFQSKDGDWKWGNIIGNLLPSAVSTVGALLSSGGNDSNIGVGNNLTFEQQKELQAAKLAADLQAAQLAAGAAGRGSGAALAAARITDARERQRMKAEAQQALLSGTLKAAEMLDNQTLADLMTARAQLAQRGGEGAANSYQGLMQALGANSPRGQRPTLGS